jgi:hypothetical protein
VKRLVMRRHPSSKGEWVCWTEVYGIDVFAQRFWRSGAGEERVAYEVKVSRSDLLAELRRPEKRALALELSNRFYFATPPGLVRPGELPEECGLVEVANRRSRAVVPAPVRAARDYTMEEMLHLLRRDLFRTGSDRLLARIKLLEDHTVWLRKLLDQRGEDLKRYQTIVEAAAG